MSFLKITDPAKRDAIVAEFLKTKKNIRQQQVNERLGEQNDFMSLAKQYKPIIDAQKHETENIIKQLVPIQDGFNALPRHIAQLAITGAERDDEGEGASGDEPPEMIGATAATYLRKYATKEADKTFGIYDQNGKFFIGDTRIGVIDNNITVGDGEYIGTPGLWELLVMKDPDEDIYTAEDYENYAEMMVKTNALRQGHTPTGKPKSNRGKKWKDILKTIWEERSQFEGEGVSTVVIPRDPDALLERFDLLMASKDAGNTGVTNEIVSICDELKRQKVMCANTYKKIMLHL